MLGHDDTSSSRAHGGAQPRWALEQREQRELPSVGTSPLLPIEPFPELDEPPLHAGSHGVHWDPKADSDDAWWQLIQVAEHERRSEGLVEGHDGANKAVLDLQSIEDRLVGWNALGPRGTLLLSAIRVSLAEHASSLVARDAREPGAEAPSAWGVRAQRRDPRLLHDVLDEVIPTQRCPGDRTHERSVLQQVFGIQRAVGIHRSAT
ncbi:MAG: hypothetical protein R3E85_15905 [Planctomycetota bacterium]